MATFTVTSSTSAAGIFAAPTASPLPTATTAAVTEPITVTSGAAAAAVISSVVAGPTVTTTAKPKIAVIPGTSATTAGAFAAAAAAAYDITVCVGDKTSGVPHGHHHLGFAENDSSHRRRFRRPTSGIGGTITFTTGVAAAVYPPRRPPIPLE